MRLLSPDRPALRGVFGAESSERRDCSRVIFLQAPFASGAGGVQPVQKIDPFRMYELASKVHPLAEPRTVPISRLGAALLLSTAGQAVALYLTPEAPMEFGLCRPAAEELKRAVDQVFAQLFHDPQTEQWVPLNDEPVDVWRLGPAQTAAQAFEAVLRAEMQAAPAFVARRRGIYDTAELVNVAQHAVPADLVPAVSSKALVELDSAGRCLAFELWTAAGFHTCRAVEAVMEDYYRQMCAGTGTLNSWYDYTQALENAIKAGKPPLPEQATINHLTTLRKYNRNEIAHPRVVLDEAEAVTVFNLGLAVILLMARELLDAGAKVAPISAIGIATSVLLSGPGQP